jgi:hypothetical protein
MDHSRSWKPTKDKTIEGCNSPRSTGTRFNRCRGFESGSPGSTPKHAAAGASLPDPKSRA